VDGELSLAAGKTVTLFDGYGNELRFPERPPRDRPADIGRVRDPWAGRTLGQITPERLGRVLRGNASLSDQMLLCKQLVQDDHVSTAARNLANAVARCPIEVVPPKSKSRVSKKIFEKTQTFVENFPSRQKFIRHLVYGELFPFVGPYLGWNPKTWGLDSWDIVDAQRWTWNDDTNSLRLRTLKNQIKGEPVNPYVFCFHSSQLEPGSIREAGLYRKIAWLWLFKNTTWTWWMRFAEMYGMPYIWGIFKRKEDRESVLEAVTTMAGNARGVFPEGTEIKLQEAQRYGTSSLYGAIKEAAEGGITKVIQGHILNTQAVKDTGTLAGNHAENVSQENKEGVAEGIGETTQAQVIDRWTAWNFGNAVVEDGEQSRIHIHSEPPEDLLTKGKTFIALTPVLAASGRAIDYTQVEDDFNVRTVPLVGAAQDVTAAENSANARRAVAASTSKKKIRTREDITAVSRALGAKAAAEQTLGILGKLDEAETLEAFRDAIWEDYDEFSSEKPGQILTQGMVVAQAIAQGDAAK
jgi:phage gp29-like protein